MTHIFFLCSLVHKPCIFLIVSVLECFYRAMQLSRREITLQNKKKSIVRTKDSWKIKKLKVYCVFIYLLMPNLCKRICPLCNRELHLLYVFSVVLEALLLTSNIQTRCQQKKFEYKEYEMQNIDYELKYH